MDNEALFVYHPETLRYRFSDSHPFNQQRLILTMDLLRRAGALPDERLIRPARRADEEELLRVHTPQYIAAVKSLGAYPRSASLQDKAGDFGLGPSGDTPPFPDMHAITATVVGGSLEAAEQVASGRCRHALHLAGGLHHAMPHRAGGFCVYNDASAVIAHLRRKHQARVLYVDTDVHHGDGVQFSFYTDPEVLTFSIHETGKYLFPGTGAVSERGGDQGFGACVNMPVEPYTEDQSWLECFEELLEAAMRKFRPDIVVSQHGCDAHAFDPLAHVHCSMNIYRAMPRLLHQMAHQYCEGRWVALGGGGYDILRVVPRAWSLLWLEMSGHPLARRLDTGSSERLPADWLQRWGPDQGNPVQKPLPACWLDQPGDIRPIPRRREINAVNEQVKQVARLYLQ